MFAVRESQYELGILGRARPRFYTRAGIDCIQLTQVAGPKG